jgi:DNA-binding NarL/FixJ family response regulator
MSRATNGWLGQRPLRVSDGESRRVGGGSAEFTSAEGGGACRPIQEGDRTQRLQTERRSRHDHALRELAVRQDSECARVFELGELWRRLRDGSWLVRDVFSTEQRHVLLAQVLPAPRPIEQRKVSVLERLLLGVTPKVVAFEDQRSLSTVTANAQTCLRDMGLEGNEARSAVVLAMAAHACLRPESALPPGRLSELGGEDEAYLVISAARPDLMLPKALSLAEAAVLRSLLAGHSYAQISGARATSTRTVANQLTTAFRKLGVSGRRETIEFLISATAR